MKRTVLALLLLPLGPHLAAAQSPPVVVRESLNPATGAIIGQHVTLAVDVLFADGMTHPPRVTLPNVPGMQALSFETQGTTMQETIDGTAYTGQRFELALYARRGGTFEIPPATVTLLDRQGGTAGTAQGQALTLDVTVPPGLDASESVVATRALTFTQSWAPPPHTAFKPGDAIVRTITRTAEDIPGLAMRDLAFPAPEGTRAYVDPPDITDQTSRGVVTGRRVDRVTYVFERAGHAVLPEVTQPWWNLAASRVETARGTALPVTVTAPAASAAPGTAWTEWLLAGAAVVLAAALGFAARHARRPRPEPRAFASVRRACAGTDARAIYRAVQDWQSFLEPARRAQACRAAAGLEAALFAGARPEWTAAESGALLSALRQVRQRRQPAVRAVPLPPLNPQGAMEHTPSRSFFAATPHDRA